VEVIRKDILGYCSKRLEYYIWLNKQTNCITLCILCPN